MDGFRHTVALGLRQIAFTLIPASVFFAVLATPITRIVYERGAWGPHEHGVTAGALAAFSLGLTFNGAMLMLNRAFFSLQIAVDTDRDRARQPLLNTLLAAALYRVGDLGHPACDVAGEHRRHGGAAVVFRRRLGRIEFGETARAVILISIASAAMAIVAYPVWHVLDDRRSAVRSGGQLASLGSAFVGRASTLLDFLPFAGSS